MALVGARMRTARAHRRLSFHVCRHRDGSMFLDSFSPETAGLDTVDRSAGRQ